MFAQFIRKHFRKKNLGEWCCRLQLKGVHLTRITGTRPESMFKAGFCTYPASQLHLEGYTLSFPTHRYTTPS